MVSENLIGSQEIGLSIPFRFYSQNEKVKKILKYKSSHRHSEVSGGGGGGGGGSLALSQVCLMHFGSSPSVAPVRLVMVSLSRHKRCKVTARVASMSAR